MSRHSSSAIAEMPEREEQSELIGEPVKVSLPVKVKIEQPKPDGMRKYWVGVVNGCAAEQASVCGIEFPLHTDFITWNASGIGRKNYIKGAQVSLTEKQVNDIKKAMPYKVIRTKGVPFGVLDIRENYIPMASDVYLAKYAYMHPIENVKLPQNLIDIIRGGEGEPETMAIVEDVEAKE